jgi:hypothetical protein
MAGRASKAGGFFRSRSVVVIGTVVIVTAASGVAFATPWSNQSVRTGPSDLLTSADGPTTEIYAAPSQGAADPQIYSLPVGATGSTGAASTPQLLSTGVTASVIPTAGGDPRIAVYGTTHSPEVFDTADPTAVAQQSILGAGGYQPGTVLLASGGDVFVQQFSNVFYGSSQIEEVDSANGSIAATYNLPVLRPDALAGVLPHGYKGAQESEAIGTIAALILDNGDLYALQYTSRAASIDNLTTDSWQYLSGYGTLGGGVLAGDGDVYVAAWRSDSDIQVLQIDPSTLSVVSTTSTGDTPEDLIDVRMQSNPTDNVLVYVNSQTTSSSPTTSQLWSASGSNLTSLVSLPQNVGAYMTDFGSDVFLYGGLAGSEVSMFDLTDSTLTQDVAGMSTPSGSYVLALT